ncbi:hypothetical protein, partial [Methyloglobulus sp.]|uniref:hypothetical protein n=1 Tax=Methyloglobulus sp. TaxID=2518622 RepID=UPI0032B7ED5D
FSRIPPIKVNANSKKSAFDQSAGVSAVCAKVSSNNQKQISQIERDARQKCLNNISSGKAEKNQKTSSDQQNVIHINGHDVPVSAIPGVSRGSRPGTVSFSDSDIARLNIEQYPKTNPKLYSSEFNECLDNISKDPLILDLRTQIEKTYEIQNKRRQYESEARKKVEGQVKIILADYAEKNKFQMIINNEYGDNNILYNSDRITLNVTEDVINFVKTNTYKMKAENSLNNIDKSKL